MMFFVMWKVIRKLLRKPERSSKIHRQFRDTMTMGIAQGTKRSVRKKLLKRRSWSRMRAIVSPNTNLMATATTV